MQDLFDNEEHSTSDVICNQLFGVTQANGKIDVISTINLGMSEGQKNFGLKLVISNVLCRCVSLQVESQELCWIFDKNSNSSFKCPHLKFKS